MDHQTAGDVSAEIVDAIGAAVIADRDFLETILTGVLARGHVLLEDVPGTGKTLTARSLANALDLRFQRIQFTPDLLPSDITGSNIYNEADGAFEFSRGPIFANIVLADEINRAPPKTQAALLEAMGEGQVTVDGTTYDLPDPFFVIATQNPVEQEGTFGLPEAQRDRFIIKTAMGYPDRAGELELLDRRAGRVEQTPSIDGIIDGDRVPALQRVAENVTVDERIRDYIVDLGRATREDHRVDVGVSPRGIQRLFEAARAVAVLQGRDFVVPDDVKWIVEPVFSHRLVLTADAGVRGVDRSAIVGDALDSVPVPGADGSGGRQQGGSQRARRQQDGRQQGGRQQDGQQGDGRQQSGRQQGEPQQRGQRQNRRQPRGRGQNEPQQGGRQQDGGQGDGRQQRGGDQQDGRDRDR